ncbi:nuclear transport factor 2 family protein [Skermania sp. ID1734]|uniref:nuclear transport factor 2 family protein n=1 Tax=Skermania sp. ID1734 TaxID=2597516 RepID=UPI00117EC620|nr:nuclear transport factor 2 family protein [Skermania sp. ID1734]TSD95724.1 nuclear transport factor 2 family protein [Skermania sp. ID1734]
MDTVHPARAAGLASQAAVRAKNKQQWLALFAPEACVEDPVGPSGFDPEGKGHHGAEGISAFWDMAIAKADSIEFHFHDSVACGNEACFLGFIRTLIGGMQIDAEGAFTYRVNDDGKIVALRAFWEVERAMSTAKPVA